MNCIQLINSLLLAAENTARNSTAPENANVNDGVASTGDRGSEEVTEFSEEAAVEENGGGDTFEFVAEPDRSIRSDSSDAESESFFEAADNQDESSDAASEFFVEATVGQNAGSDSSVSDAGSDSSVSDIGDENETPVHRGSNVATAFKIVSRHPAKDISRKTRMKPRTSEELRAFKAHVKNHLVQLFSLSFCFNRKHRKFTRCTCLNMLEGECCFDSLAARIGMFVA
jgi:hypothetical protein